MHFRGLEWLTATSNTYTKNYVADIHSPYASARTIQSNGILVEDLVGRLDLSSSSFDSNSGMNGFSTSGVYSSINGFASQLIGFNRVTLTELLFNDMSFSSNFGEREEEDIPSTYEKQPRLFTLEQDMFVNYAYMLTINNLSLISNKFKRTGAIAEFKL